MNKALILVMCDVLVLSAMSLSNGAFSSSGLSGNDTDRKSFTQKEIDDAKVKQIAELEKYKSELELAKKSAKIAKKEAEQAKEREKELKSEVATVKADADSERKGRIAAEEREKTAKKEAEQAKERAKELESEVATVKADADSEKKERIAAEKRAETAEKEAGQAKERAKELESEVATVKADADSEKKERIAAEKRAETAEKEAGQAKERAKELKSEVATAKADADSEKKGRIAAEKKIADIKEAEEEKKRRIDRMNYAIGEMWVSQKNKEEMEVYGLVVRTNSNEEGGRYLLVNEDKIKKIKDISSITIKMKLEKEEVSYSVKNVFTLKNNGKKTGMILLEFDPPREIFSFFLDADEWEYELDEKKFLHHFQAESGSTHVVDTLIKEKGSVTVAKTLGKTGGYSAGDVLIFAKSGRVALIFNEEDLIRFKQKFVPIEKIELEKVSLGE